MTWPGKLITAIDQMCGIAGESRRVARHHRNCAYAALRQRLALGWCPGAGWIHDGGVELRQGFGCNWRAHKIGIEALQSCAIAGLAHSGIKGAKRSRIHLGGTKLGQFLCKWGGQGAASGKQVDQP